MGEAGRTVEVVSLLFMALRMFFWVGKALLILAWYVAVIFVKLLPSLIKATVLLIGVAVIVLKLLFSLVVNLIGGVAEGIEWKRRQKLAIAPVPPVDIADTVSLSSLSQDFEDTSGGRLEASRDRPHSSPQSSPVVMMSSSPVAVAGEQDQMTSRIPESKSETFLVGPDPLFTDDKQGDQAEPASWLPRHVAISIALSATPDGPKTDPIREPLGIPNSFAPRSQTLGWTALGIAIAGSAMIILGASDRALIAFLGLGVLFVAPASGVLAILAVVFGGIGLRRRRLQHRRSAAKSGLALGIVAFCLPTMTLIVTGVIGAAWAK